MALTITIPGAVEATIGATAPAVLTVGVGTPGATGPAGAAGPGVPVGGSAGQYLQKIDGTNYNTDWVTLNLAAYAPLASPIFTGDPTAPTPATSDNDTSIATTAFVKAQGYLTSAPVTSVAGRTGAITLSNTDISGLGTMSTASASNYSTTAVADTLYAPIAAGLPTGGTVGQILTKQSGTNFDASFQTLIPGDRYLTSSTTSNTVSNGNKTFTIGTGLSYTPTQNITISYDASNHMHGEVLTYNSGTGVLTVDINHHTGSGTYTAWVVNVGGVTPATSVAWGAITGTISAQSDLQGQLDLKANLASPSFTGNVSISSSTGAALFIQQTGTGNILTLHDQASDTTFVAIDANGKVSTIASEATNGAGFNIAHGVAPTSPVNGDIWTTTSGLFMRQNGTTRQYVDFDSSQTINGNKTFSNATQTLGNSTATGTIGVASGATISASTKTVNVATGGVVGSTTNTTIGPVLGASTTSIGNTTAASTLNLATGATLTATTKAVNIGTAGVAGSTTNIAIGSTTGTSTTTLQGITNGITAAADTNSTALATTAFVVGQASSTTPLADGTAAVGTSLRYARADHVHPSSGGGGGTDFQAYTTPGTYTWTKPAGAKWVEVYLLGGGGGGGAGARYATSSIRGGGAGGSGGTMALMRFAASDLGATQTVVVGAGGAGGVAQSTDSTAGATGLVGGNTTFSNYHGTGGQPGAGGTNTAGGASGGFRTNFLFGGLNNASCGPGGAGATTTGNAGSNVASTGNWVATGGGGGAGAIAASTTAAAGGAGGNKSFGSGGGLIASISGGSGGTTAGVSPTAGVSGTLNGGSTGGGGGAYRTAIAGMAGAIGGPGGGGGGGSASDNGFASGAGSVGGNGVAYIITYC